MMITNKSCLLKFKFCFGDTSEFQGFFLKLIWKNGSFKNRENLQYKERAASVLLSPFMRNIGKCNISNPQVGDNLCEFFKSCFKKEILDSASKN